MTLRARVLEHINANPGFQFTNGQLAAYLAAPEPSIRRATLRLEAQGDIQAVVNTFNPIFWQARQIEQTSEATAEVGN